MPGSCLTWHLPANHEVFGIRDADVLSRCVDDISSDTTKQESRAPTTNASDGEADRGKADDRGTHFGKDEFDTNELTRESDVSSRTIWLVL